MRMARSAGFGRGRKALAESYCMRTVPWTPELLKQWMSSDVARLARAISRV